MPSRKKEKKKKYVEATKDPTVDKKDLKKEKEKEKSTV